MTAAAAADTPLLPSRALRIVVSLIAALECVLAADDFPGAFTARGEPMTAGQFLINAGLFLHPFFAVTALVLAVTGRVRAALIVLAVYIVLAWCFEIPGLLRYGFEGSFSTVGLSLIGQQIVFPLLAVAALVLAAKNMRLWLAAIFVALPPLNLVLGVAIFTISVILYGF